VSKSGDQFFPVKPEVDTKRGRRTQRATSFRKTIVQLWYIDPMGQPRGPLPVVGAFSSGPRAQLPTSGLGLLNFTFCGPDPQGGEGRPSDPDDGRWARYGACGWSRV